MKSQLLFSSLFYGKSYLPNSIFILRFSLSLSLYIYIYIYIMYIIYIIYMYYIWIYILYIYYIYIIYMYYICIYIQHTYTCFVENNWCHQSAESTRCWALPIYINIYMFIKYISFFNLNIYIFLKTFFYELLFFKNKNHTLYLTSFLIIVLLSSTFSFFRL